MLDRSPEAAVRTLALHHLDAAAAAAESLQADTDPEALHDFRVALRRLRTLLKLYRGLLRESVSKKQARALRDLHRSTGGARDAEVQLAWLESRRDDLAPGAQRAFAWLVERLEARRADSTVRDDLLDRFRELEAELRSGLSRYQATISPEAPPATLASAMAEMVRRTGNELVTALATVRAATDAEEAHRARIEGKRFRYLVEPLHGSALEQPVERLAGSIKTLQELLGNLHDMHVLAEEIATSLVETAAEQARRLHEALYSTDPTPPEKGLRSGLLAIDRLVRDRVQALYQELCAQWPPERRTVIAAEVGALAAALDRHGRAVTGEDRQQGENPAA